MGKVKAMYCIATIQNEPIFLPKIYRVRIIKLLNHLVVKTTFEQSAFDLETTGLNFVFMTDLK